MRASLFRTRFGDQLREAFLWRGLGADKEKTFPRPRAAAGAKMYGEYI